MIEFLKEYGWFLYFGVGIWYAIYNATKRNLDGKDDPFLVLMWMMLPWLFMIMRLFSPKKKKPVSWY